MSDPEQSGNKSTATGSASLMLKIGIFLILIGLVSIAILAILGFSGNSNSNLYNIAMYTSLSPILGAFIVIYSVKDKKLPEQNGDESAAKSPDLTDWKPSSSVKIVTLISSALAGALPSLLIAASGLTDFDVKLQTSHIIFWTLSILFMLTIYFSTIYTIEQSGKKIIILGKIFTEKVRICSAKIVALIVALTIGMILTEIIFHAFHFSSNLILVIFLLIFALILFNPIHKFIKWYYNKCMNYKESFLTMEFKGTKIVIISWCIGIYTLLIIGLIALLLTGWGKSSVLCEFFHIKSNVLLMLLISLTFTVIVLPLLRVLIVAYGDVVGSAFENRYKSQ